MKGDTRERWHLLCEQAADEQDHEKLMQLISEITRLLDEKEKRLGGAEAGNGNGSESMSRHNRPETSDGA